MTYIPEKAYKNLDFLNSPAARHIRILCEYEETRQRFLQEKVRSTIVMFGSARAKPGHVADQALADATAAAAAHPGPEAEAALVKARGGAKLGRYYDETRELARRLTEWGLTRSDRQRAYVCSGGGPGIMEAANRGAADVPGGRSVGLGISLPFEAGVNEWVTKELAFEFHYFFTRKYWFLYLAKALVVFPGGFGTMDEFFESLTLVQTRKIKKPMPVVLYGSEYWDRVLDLEVMAEWGTISPEDPDLYHRVDTVDDAFEVLTASLAANGRGPG